MQDTPSESLREEQARAAGKPESRVWLIPERLSHSHAADLNDLLSRPLNSIAPVDQMK